MTGSRKLLLVTVSALALGMAVPAGAADLPAHPLIMKAPVVPPLNPWTFWLEGGAQGLSSSGDTNILGFNSAFATPARTWGWTGAAGLDYRLDPSWHVSADFRYGQNKGRSASSTPRAFFSICTTSTCSNTQVRSFVGQNSATRDEHNWEADFMVGRDIGLGGTSQVKFGLRVAEIRGTTNGNAVWSVPTNTSSSTFTTHKVAYQQTNRFLGAGPRLAIEGTVPASSGWFFQYEGGVAGLYGLRSVEQSVTVTGGGSCVSGCPFATIPSTLNPLNNDGFVFNADGMAGLGFAFSPSAKLSFNYRVDAYFNALRVINSAGNATNVNRIYHGPNLRLTVSY